MVSERIADVAFRGIVLVERVVLDGVNIGKLGCRQAGKDADKRGCDHKPKENFTEGCWLGVHFNFQKRLDDT